MNNPANQIKVIHIASGDRWAGAEAQVFTLLKTLKQRSDISVYAVILNEGELANKLQKVGINTTVLNEAQLSSWQILLRLRALFQAIQPNIIHTHRLKENVLASIANLINNAKASVTAQSATPRTKAALVATIHGDSEHHHPLWKLQKNAPQWINWLCTRFFYKKLIAVSKDLAEKLSKKYPKHLLQVIENGIDIEAVQQAANSSHFATDPTIQHHIGIAGRLEQVKRVDIFLDTAQLLINSSPKNTWHFHIFGEGSLEATLKAQAQTNATTNHVTFHGHRNDIASCLKAMDCLIMCSDHEALPMTPLESIAVGTPVIAHSVGGLIDIIGDNCGGALVSDHQPEGYAQAVSKLFSNEQRLESIRKNGLEKIGKTFAARVNSDWVIEVYSDLLTT